MSDSVYDVIELVGTSTESWEKAAKAAIEMAAKSLRDLRIAEIEKLDVQLKDGKVETYRSKVKVSFKYEGKGYLQPPHIGPKADMSLCAARVRFGSAAQEAQHPSAHRDRSDSHHLRRSDGSLCR